MRLTIAYSKIKKRNLVLINNDTYQRETLSERPIRQPLTDLILMILVSPLSKNTCPKYGSSINVQGLNMFELTICYHFSPRLIETILEIVIYTLFNKVKT